MLNSTNFGVENFLSDNKIKLKDVEVMTVDGNGRTYVKEKTKKYKILNFNVAEGNQW